MTNVAEDIDYGLPFENVFELEQWTLYKHANGVALKHKCHHNMGNRKLIVKEVFVYPSSSQACWRCTEEIPKGMVALSLLYNWDNR